MTPMQETVCHLDMCRALHNLHRATLHGTWNFQPLCIDLEKPDAKPVSFVYLEERLYLFREGNTYRMAYGSNPIEAYAIAFEESEVGGRPASEEQPKPKRSNQAKKCVLFMNTANGRSAEPQECRSIAEAVRIARESDLYFAYRVVIGYRIVRRGYCGGGK